MHAISQNRTVIFCEWCAVSEYCVRFFETVRHFENGLMFSEHCLVSGMGVPDAHVRECYEQCLNYC